jgi:bifunctional DNase/RNase
VVSDFNDLFGDWRPEDDRRNSPDDAALEPENRGQRALNEKEVRVVNVWEGILEPAGAGLTSHGGQTFFVQLKDNRGREFRIYVMRDMALSIAMALDNDTPDRPFTHDLMKTMMDRLGVTVERIIIDDLWQDTFYAKICVTQNGKTSEIDARPSDAIALALRCRAAIYVAEDVLERAQQDY